MALTTSLKESHLPRLNRQPRAVATSRMNRAAGKYLRGARKTTSQFEFAGLLSWVLRFELDPDSLSYYENGRYAVPGAVVLAAHALTLGPCRHSAWTD